MANAKNTPAAKVPAAAKAATKAAPKAPTKVTAAAAEAAPATAAPTTAADAAPAKRTPNAGFMMPMTPSAALAAVIGKKAIPRTEVTKKVWEYIKKHKLQDAANKRMINADAKLQPIFEKPQVSMFEMTKLISGHLS